MMLYSHMLCYVYVHISYMFTYHAPSLFTLNHMHASSYKIYTQICTYITRHMTYMLLLFIIHHSLLCIFESDESCIHLTLLMLHSTYMFTLYHTTFTKLNLIVHYVHMLTYTLLLSFTCRIGSLCLECDETCFISLCLYTTYMYSIYHTVFTILNSRY